MDILDHTYLVVNWAAKCATEIIQNEWMNELGCRIRSDVFYNGKIWNGKKYSFSNVKIFPLLIR